MIKKNIFEKNNLLIIVYIIVNIIGKNKEQQ